VGQTAHLDPSVEVGVSGRVVGHARLMRVAGRSDAVLVETGIRGWGVH